MTALDPDIALNRRIQLCRVHVAPTRQSHDAPADGGTAPAVIVGSCNHGEVQGVREREYACARSLNYPDALGRSIAQFNRIETRGAVQLIVRQLAYVAWNRED